MFAAPSIPFRRRRAAPRAVRPSPRTAWDQAVSLEHAVEIYAPDRERSDLLVEYATPLFRPEIVPGLVWVVRMQPPSGGPGWALELLSLVERWLQTVKLPWVTVVYDGRSYLIRAHSRSARAGGQSPAQRTVEVVS